MITIPQFMLIGRAEGLSYLLLLLVAMPLKYLADMPLAVKYVGWAHGLLFVLYVVAILLAGIERKWGIWKMGLFFIAGLLPFGPFIAEKKLLRQDEIEG
jgi:integral membrane protein